MGPCGNLIVLPVKELQVNRRETECWSVQHWGRHLLYWRDPEHSARWLDRGVRRPDTLRCRLLFAPRSSASDRRC